MTTWLFVLVFFLQFMPMTLASHFWQFQWRRGSPCIQWNSQYLLKRLGCVQRNLRDSRVFIVNWLIDVFKRRVHSLRNWPDCREGELNIPPIFRYLKCLLPTSSSSTREALQDLPTQAELPVWMRLHPWVHQEHSQEFQQLVTNCFFFKSKSLLW